MLGRVKRPMGRPVRHAIFGVLGYGTRVTDKGMAYGILAIVYAFLGGYAPCHPRLRETLSIFRRESGHPFD